MKTFLLFLVFAFQNVFNLENGEDILDRRETMYITVNNDFESQLIIDELTRDWTKTSAKLSPEQLKLFQEEGEEYNKLRDDLRLDFVFLTLDKAPLEARKVLSYSFGKRGSWEQIDKRAFLTSTYPLKTVEYIYRTYYNDKEKIRFKRKVRKYEDEYQKEYEKWKKQTHEIIKRLYPEMDATVNEVHCSRQTIAFEGYDKKLNKWITMFKIGDKNINNNIDDILTEHYGYFNENQETKYINFYWVQGSITSVNFYSEKQKKFIQITENLDVFNKNLPPDDLRPLIYQKPVPPWGENEADSSLDD